MSNWVKNFSPTQKTIVVLRHGAREELQSGCFGNDLNLTPEGRLASSDLGRLLQGIPLGEIHSSPLLRCIQTTEEMLKGAKQKVPVILSKVLGDPGPFVKDPVKAGPLFLQKSLQEIAQDLVNEKQLPGIRTLIEGGKVFLDYIAKVKHFPCLMISHDIIICLICCFLLESKNVLDNMPGFLDGFTITIDAENPSAFQIEKISTLKFF